MENKTDIEFNSNTFEKKLSTLKDSQESINSCCQWCLANRQYHKKIVSSWLNVLKRVKIEQRLILFYLANDVIQYAKRRNYEFVESWGTTLQKATTMVRDEKVKNKVLRIFKIWEQRGIYGEEFIADLCGLISATPSGQKNNEPQEFQSSYLIQKIKLCAQLELDTDLKLRELKEHNPKIQLDGDALIASLKDRAHVDDVEKELDDYNKQMESYINTLKLEIKARIHLISLLTQAEKALDSDKKDVKTVTSAYKAFAIRVKTLKKKLDEKIPTLSSPPPSPDVNAPSPGPDSDIELPTSESSTPTSSGDTVAPAPALQPPTPTTSSISNLLGSTDILKDPAVLYTTAGFYNPVPAPTPVTDSSSSFNNPFATFIGSDLSLNLQNLRKSDIFHDSSQQPSTVASVGSQTATTNTYSINEAISSLFPSMAFPPPPPTTSSPLSSTGTFQFGNPGHLPLSPPPVMIRPNKPNDSFSNSRFPETFNGSNVNSSQPSFLNTNYQVPPLPVAAPSESPSASPVIQPPLPTSVSSGDEYNPEEELETWVPEPTWDAVPPIELDTPESPPMYEKAGYGDPIEYREGISLDNVEDVDHRILLSEDLTSRTTDVDHRNLISLTDSPSNQDQDYRRMNNSPEIIKDKTDQDYRAPFDIENFKLPPPPPPPPKMPPGDMMNDINAFNTYTQLQFSNQFNNYVNSQTANMNSTPLMLPKSDETHSMLGQGKTNQHSVESMELDENDSQMYLSDDDSMNDPIIGSPVSEDRLQLPPPFPDLLDDVDANQFLDNVSEDLEEFGAGDLDNLDHPTPSNSDPMGSCPIIFPPNYSNPPNPNLLGPDMLQPVPPWMINMAIGGCPPNRFQFPNFQNLGGANNIDFNGSMKWGQSWENIRGYSNEFRGPGPRGLRGGPNFRMSRGRASRRGFVDRGRADFRSNFRDSF